MIFAVSTYDFYSKLSTGELNLMQIPQIAKDIGFDAIEVAGIEPKDGKTALEIAKAFRLECERVGTKVVSYSVSGEFLKNDVDTEAERLYKEVDIAHALGAVYMRHDVTWATSFDGHKSFAKNLHRLADGCRKVTVYAEKLGIVTTIENHGQYCQDSERVEMLIDEVNHPNYGAQVDLGNFLCVDENPTTALGRLRPYIRTVHVKDFIFHQGDTEPSKEYSWFPTRGGNFLRGTVAGKGVVPLVQCFRMLKKYGYDGVVTLEYEGQEDCVQAVAEGLRFIKSNMGARHP